MHSDGGTECGHDSQQSVPLRLFLLHLGVKKKRLLLYKTTLSMIALKTKGSHIHVAHPVQGSLHLNYAPPMKEKAKQIFSSDLSVDLCLSEAHPTRKGYMGCWTVCVSPHCNGLWSQLRWWGYWSIKVLHHVQCSLWHLLEEQKVCFLIKVAFNQVQTLYTPCLLHIQTWSWKW